MRQKVTSENRGCHETCNDIIEKWRATFAIFLDEISRKNLWFLRKAQYTWRPLIAPSPYQLGRWYHVPHVTSNTHCFSKVKLYVWYQIRYTQFSSIYFHVSQILIWNQLWKCSYVTLAYAIRTKCEYATGTAVCCHLKGVCVLYFTILPTFKKRARSHPCLY